LCVSSSVFVTVVEAVPSGLMFWAIIKTTDQQNTVTSSAI
jgi:hypothetical protein